MSFLRGLVCFCISFISIASQGQSPPVEWTTFTSHGKPISCAVYSPQDASATIIVLRGVSPSGQSNGNALAQFFVEHGYRVLLPDYVNATSSVTPTAANFRRWAQVVDDMVADLVARPLPRNKIIALAGQDLGASVALLAASNKSGIAAVAEWSGSLPNEFFAQVQSLPPLLILHGEQDEEVPVVNARQLIRLCKLKDLTCELGIYPAERHVFSRSAIDSSDLRALNFFRSYLK